MRFSLRALLYITAHVSMALAAFGVPGIAVSGFVVAFWAYVLSPMDRLRALGQAIVAAIVLLCGVGLLLPAVSSVRESARRALCGANLKHIALALQAYHQQHGEFPPAYIPDTSGKPMHSWRVLLLPHLEHGHLHDQYDFTEPWDGPNNRKLIKQGPYIYLCPSSQNWNWQTDYFVVRGSAAFPDGQSSGLDQLADGTLLLMEKRIPNVAWSEPRDLTREEALMALTSTASPSCHVSEGFFFHEDVGFNVACFDTSTHTILQPLREQDAAALLSGEGLDLSQTHKLGDSARPVRPRWSRIISCSFLLALTLWPLKYCRQQRSEPK